MSSLYELSDLSADTRQWISIGSVCPEQDGTHSVEFDDDLGPIVDVKLHPSAAHVRCRVGSWCSGNGEGSYFPFVEGDEVLVSIPQGDERSGPVVVCRLNNQLDRFPKTIGGQDVTQNTVAFQRTRCPFVLESADAIMLTSAVTHSFFLLEKAGNVTCADGFKSFLHLGADYVGLSCADEGGNVAGLLQFDRQDKLFTIELTDSGKLMILANGNATWTQAGTISLASSGMVPCEHAVSIETVLCLLSEVLRALAAFSAPGALSGLGIPGTAEATLIGAMTLAQAGFNPAFGLREVLMTKLATKVQNQTGLTPGLGCPGILIG